MEALAQPSSMNNKSVLSKSLQLFELEKVDRDIFSWNGTNVGYKRIFGGQVMAQTLIAAYKTVEVEHYAHSFHSYFLRPGDIKKLISISNKYDLAAIKMEVGRNSLPDENFLNEVRDLADKKK